MSIRDMWKRLAEPRDDENKQKITQRIDGRFKKIFERCADINSSVFAYKNVRIDLVTSDEFDQTDQVLIMTPGQLTHIYENIDEYVRYYKYLHDIDVTITPMETENKISILFHNPNINDE